MKNTIKLARYLKTLYKHRHAKAPFRPSIFSLANLNWILWTIETFTPN
ncbi:hypothetical protein Nmel_006253 [Mimus melanotis]